MKNNEYIENCLRTESPVTDEMTSRVSTKRNIRLLHGVLGLSSEIGECVDAIKKHIFYGKELDIVNIKEEIQDCLWYISLIFDELDYTYEEAMVTNINKLKARYPEKFTAHHAENRDLETERSILEGSSL